MTERQQLNKHGEVEKFDQIADKYSDLHAANISASGEGVEYFARYKLECLKRHGVSSASRVLDFGCGIGNLTRLLATHFEAVCGYDPSQKSIEFARTRGGGARYHHELDELRSESFDAVVLAGVLHHVPPLERVPLLTEARHKLRPGARVFVFEHNPLNPLTRRAVETCPFDDDAILLSAREVKSGLQDAGFVEVAQSFIVFFPKSLSWFRPIEPALGFCPLGAQTLTIGAAP